MAMQKGINPERLLFTKPLSQEEHLARLQCADLLDTQPYNVLTTASDALWAGVLLLTLRRRYICPRVAGSILSVLGLLE